MDASRSATNTVAAADESQQVRIEKPHPSKVVFVTTSKTFGGTSSTKLSSLEDLTRSDDTASLVSSISESENYAPCFRVKAWDRKTRYSDLIADGLRYKNRDTSNVILLFESPSTSTTDSSFYNGQVYKFHDYPPAPSISKGILGPCRYSMMNGSTFPSFLRNGEPPAGLMEHWTRYVPDFTAPSFVSSIPNEAHVYAYLPVETITNHVNDTHVHYHMVGKDAIHLMTDKTTKLLANTSQQRPCIAKTTHSMGSKGIFVIRNDQDEAEFHAFLAESGNPTFVVTEFVEIARNVACHFFMHPNGEIVWLGSNENIRNDDGTFSSDSYLLQEDQDYLREIQLPYVKDVATYCQSLGFWGFCGVDVLFDKHGQGYLVDVNPRVTGSCPSLMVASLLRDKYGYEVGLFRRSGKISFYGTAVELFAQVEEFNTANEGHAQIVLFAVLETEPGLTKINMGVYGNNADECLATLDHFGKPKPEPIDVVV
jgi:hypothetical protein